MLDPDAAVQQAIHLLFDTFARTGSAWKTVQFFTTHAIPFPRRVHNGPHRGELVWGPLVHGRVRQILHNPRYAGAFCFGRTHTRYTGDHKSHVEWLPPSEWMALVHNAHPGYITWDHFEDIQRRLRDNAKTYDTANSAHSPREGLALIQGLVLCGRCGRRMTVRYHERQWGLVPDYVCQYEGIAEGQAICQSVPGQAIDATIGELVVTIISPTVLQQTLAVQEEYRQQMRAVERLRQQEIDRARYEVHAAHRRYLLVDPANRLVAQSLETDWNTKLQILADLEATADRHHQEEPTLTPSQEAAIAALATDVPRLWADLATPQRERKRLVRLVIADVTLTRETEHILIQVRLHSGHTQTFRIPRPLTIGERRRTAASIVQQIDDLLNEGPENYVARVLNERGVRPVDGPCFTKDSVRHLREAHHLKSRRQRLRVQGWLTQNEVAAALHCGIATVKAWRRQGVLHAEAYNDHPEYLYAPLTYPIPNKGQWKRGWTATPEVMPQTEKEV